MTAIIGNVITLLPLLLITTLVLINPFEYVAKKNFLYLLAVTAIESFLEIITVINTANNANAAIVSALSNVLGFALAPLVGYLMLSIIMKNTNFESLKPLLKLPLYINAFLCIGSLWFGWVFTVTTNNIYFRGPLFMVQFFINLFYFTLFVFIDFSKMKSYMLEDLLCRGISYVLVIGSIITQVIFPNLLLIWGTVSICLIFHFISVQSMQIRRDPLTFAFNRLCYDNTLRKSRGKKGLTIIIIDVNNFKRVNDTFGHLAGDTLLCTIANELQLTFKEFGHTYRIGGDEFAVIASNLNYSQIPKLFNSLEHQLLSHKKNLGISTVLSYGFCDYDPSIHKDIYAAIKTADHRMYICKHKNKGKFLSI